MIPASKEFLAFASAVLMCIKVFAWPALQFVADDRLYLDQTNGIVSAWHSVDLSVVASPTHIGNSAWIMPCYADGCVSFNFVGGTSSPMSFASAKTNLVSRAFIVASSTAPANLATILDAPCPLRLLPEEEAAPACFATSSLLDAIDLQIDCQPSNSFSLGLHLYEVVFGEACPLSSLYLGGSPATPAWNRNWRGAANELVFMSPDATVAEISAVRAYLSRKWRLGRYRIGTVAERNILRSLGIDYGVLYASQMQLR